MPARPGNPPGICDTTPELLLIHPHNHAAQTRTRQTFSETVPLVTQVSGLWGTSPDECDIQPPITGSMSHSSAWLATAMLGCAIAFILWSMQADCPAAPVGYVKLAPAK